MRIVAGTLRGRTFETPRGDDVIRPTADRVRETLFNVLGQSCEGLTVLDLYAGTGALAYEALSRGAVFAVLVDRAREALDLCRRNIEGLKLGAQTQVIASPVERVWATLRAQPRRFDLVFADPPYALKVGADVLREVESVLAPAARVVIETGTDEALPQQVGRLQCIDERRFGVTIIRIYALAP